MEKGRFSGRKEGAGLRLNFRSEFAVKIVWVNSCLACVGFFY